MTDQPVDDLTTALRNLRLRQDQELASLLARHSDQQQTLRRSFAPARATVPPPRHSLDRDGNPLRLRSQVTLLTRGRSGRVGDLAVVTALPSPPGPNRFVTVRLSTTGTTTTRKARNLRLTPRV